MRGKDVSKLVEFVDDEAVVLMRTSKRSKRRSRLEVSSDEDTRRKTAKPLCLETSSDEETKEEKIETPTRLKRLEVSSDEETKEENISDTSLAVVVEDFAPKDLKSDEDTRRPRRKICQIQVWRS